MVTKCNCFTNFPHLHVFHEHLIKQHETNILLVIYTHMWMVMLIQTISLAGLTKVTDTNTGGLNKK